MSRFRGRVLASSNSGLAFSSISGFLYAAVAAAVMLVVAALRGGQPLGRAHLVRLAGAAVVTAALLWLQVAPFRALAREWRFGRTLADNERYAVSLSDYLGVPPEHFLHGVVGIGRAVDLERETLFPGLTVAALAALGLPAALSRRTGLWPALLPYVAMTGVAAVLALGPTLATPWGAAPMPYRLLYAFMPGFDAIRAPRRFAAFVGLGLALLAAAGAGWLLRCLGPQDGLSRSRASGP